MTPHPHPLSFFFFNKLREKYDTTLPIPSTNDYLTDPTEQHHFEVVVIIQNSNWLVLNINKVMVFWIIQVIII